MKLDLSTLEIRILLRCSESMLNRTDITQIYFKHSKEERSKAITNLIEREFILALELPKPGARKVPIYYEITEKGRQWVKKYLDNYPK